MRRIEARTGHTARRSLNADSAKLRSVAQILKASPELAVERLTGLVEDRRRLERELTDARRKLAMGGGGAQAEAPRSVAGVSLMARAVTGIDMRDLRSLANDAKTALGSGVVALVGVGEDGKAALVVAVTPDLTARFSAVDLVRAGVESLGGTGGGGRPDMAQGGGPDGARAEAALAAVESAMAAGSAAAE